jgi:hypothetical protein
MEKCVKRLNPLNVDPPDVSLGQHGDECIIQGPYVIVQHNDGLHEGESLDEPGEAESRQDVALPPYHV